ncbi:hypothetical protein ACFLSI_06520, partial [Bacteroidota bacterium]
FILCLFAFGLIASSQVFAGNSELFSYNKKAIETEFAELNSIEEYVLLNDGITLSVMHSGNIDIANNLTSFSLSNSTGFVGPLMIPSFIWGCVLGPIGVLAVYVLADDPKSETKKALWGCILGSLLWGSSSFLYYR